MQTTKPYNISKKAVVMAYRRVKANKGTYGIDEQSIEAVAYTHLDVYKRQKLVF